MKLILTLLFALLVYIFPQTILAGSYDGSISASASSCAPTPCTVNISWSTSFCPDTSNIYVENNGVLVPGTNQTSATNFPVNINNGSNNFKLVVCGVEKSGPSVTGSAAVPTPAPAPKTCNQDCSGSDICVSGLSCLSGKCRLPAYPNESNCSAPSYPEYRSCNQSCGGGNQQCLSGLSCINNLCRHPQYPNNTDCSAPSGGTSSSIPTPTKSPSGGTASVLGANVTPTVSPNGEILGAEATVAAGIEQTESNLDISPTPTPSGVIQSIKDHPIISLVVGALAIGLVAGFLKFKAFLA